jgi:class 3 adenylate cyclase/DNA-binding CsgD family transcriptional regulator
VGSPSTEGTVTILFTDVEGSTALHADKGDAEARAILAACDDLVRQQVQAHDGRAIKSLGDGLMVTFASSRRAVACALGIQDAIAAYGYRQPRQHVRVRVGLHTGEATEVGGDLFGAAVNAAARICAKAQGGEILASDVVRQLCGLLPDASFTDRGRVSLKGFPERWHLYRVTRVLPPAVATDPAAAFGLYGRLRDMEALDRSLSVAAGGRDQVVFVEGEGGIGKTRLVAEALTAAEARGFQVLRSRAEELERNRPFGAVADALGCHRRSPDPERAAIGQLLTGELDEELGGGAALQFRVVEAFLELVEGLAAAGPVALTLEDLHWADPATLLAVRSLSRRLTHLPIVLIGTFRPTPRRAELDRLVDACVAEGGLHLRLGPLDDEAVVGLVAEAVGAEPGRRLRRELARAGGNPLFVLELARAMREEGVLQLAHGRAEVAETNLSPTLRSTILRRLSVLPEATLEVLRLASILGSTLSLADLSVVSRRPPVEVLSALQEAIRAGFVGDAGHQLAFRHDLVREALYQELPESVRAALHREAGRALAAAGASAVQVATHLALAASPGDAEAVEWLQRAAAQVMARAPGVATELLERAVELVDGADPNRDSLLATLTAVLIRSGRVTDGAALAREVLGRDHGSALEGLLRVTLSSALIGLGRAEEAIAVAEDAPDGRLTDGELVQLRANACFARAWNGDLDRAAADAALVRLTAEDLGHDLAWCFAVSALSLVTMFRGQVVDAVPLATEVVERTGRGPTGPLRASPDPWPVALFPSHYWLAICLMEADQLDEAGHVLETGRRFCEELGNPAFLPRLQWASALRHFVLGEWDDATTGVEAGMTMLGEGGARQGAVYAHSVLAVIAVHRGDVHSAEASVAAAERELAMAGPQYRVDWPAWARGVLQEAQGTPDQALRSVEEAWERAMGLGFVSELPVLGPDLVRLALTTGARDRARVVTEAVEDVASRMGVASAAGAGLRCRGLLEADPQILLEAVAAHREVQRPLQRAFACEEAAMALGSAGRPGEARPLLNEALDLYETLGAQFDIDRASSGARSLGVRRGRRGARRRPPTGWEALSPTELRVVELAAEGMTNSQIGKRLFISHYTVATHLAHVFVKLGVSSRVELAAKVARRPG